jgi:hypothetical protein
MAVLTLFAIVDAVNLEATAHYIGLPPAIEESGVERERLKAAEIVYLRPEDAGFYLLRYRSDGSFVGDTWHATSDDALEQANYEFRFSGDGWQPLPDNSIDLAEASKTLLKGSTST